MSEKSPSLMSGVYGRALALALALLFVAWATPAVAAESVEWGLGEDRHALDKTHENLNWGFRDVPWGREKDEVEEQYELVQCSIVEPGVESCLAANAVPQVDGIPLEYVRFVFVNEAFSGVSLKYDEEHYKAMLEKLLALLGDPSGKRETFPYWDLPLISAWASNTHFSVRKRPEPAAEEADPEAKAPSDSPTF